MIKAHIKIKKYFKIKHKGIRALLDLFGKADNLIKDFIKYNQDDSDVSDTEVKTERGRTMGKASILPSNRGISENSDENMAYSEIN